LINHVYTLLRNLGPAGALEYVDPRFRPLALDDDLRAVRAQLFGSDPDQTGVEYRLRQFLTILHAGDFADHLYDIDPRVSYLPLDAGEPFAWGTMVDTLGHHAPLFIHGNYAADDAAGRCTSAWEVYLTAGVLLPTLRSQLVSPNVTTPPTATVSVDTASGISAPLSV
jgi:hypothetical protein